MFMFKTAFAVFSMTCMSFVHAENLSNLIVLNDVQTGMWTIASEGVAKSPMFPKSTETLCVTKAQIIKNFSHGLYTNTKTGAEILPTVLTVNTPTLGVAEVNFPAQQIGAVVIPASAMNYTIKRVQKDKWLITMGSSISKDKFTTTATYHGEKTALCAGKEDLDGGQGGVEGVTGRVKFKDTDNSCEDYPYLFKAIPKFETYGGFTFDSAECKTYKESFDSKDIVQVSLVIKYVNANAKTKMHIGFTEERGSKKIGLLNQLEKYNNPNKAKDEAQSNLKLFNYAMTAFGHVDGDPDYTMEDFPHGIRYAQYSGEYKNRYNLIMDIFGIDLMNAEDVDAFVKEYLEAFKLASLK
jgi:hypothetical protein